MKLKYISIALLATALVSCEDFLDKQPPSYVIPEDYYQSEDQLQAVCNKFYADVLPSHGNWNYGTFGNDNNTDNQAGLSADGKYATGQWLVGLDDNDNWKWENIRNINYSLNTVLGHYQRGEISGSDQSIRQYIGELYFFRAYSYFTMAPTKASANTSANFISSGLTAISPCCKCGETCLSSKRLCRTTTPSW